MEQPLNNPKGPNGYGAVHQGHKQEPKEETPIVLWICFGVGFLGGLAWIFGACIYLYMKRKQTVGPKTKLAGLCNMVPACIILVLWVSVIVLVAIGIILGNYKSWMGKD
eukprot:Filipodium_phascolosomae@DN6642_c0_g1_i1.p1